MSDNGEPPKSSQVRVMIKVLSNDLNENKSNSEKLSFLTDTSDNNLIVSEDEKVGHMLMMSATNGLSKREICSHLIESNRKGTFAIVDGALMLAKKLNFESARLYNLTIFITDGHDSHYINVRKCF